jgi:signal transduction histidine kinase
LDTYFAPPERSNDEQLRAEIELISKNAVIDGLLHSASGLLAILNEHRQILALNDSLLEALGCNNVDEALGLRPGEALKCVHSSDTPNGCGTGEYCSTCGAVIAIITSLVKDESVEKECVLTIERDNKNVDLYFRVRCVPITYDTKRLLLLFLQDITYHQRLAALERMFFHDINGIVHGLLNASQLVIEKEGKDRQALAQTINRLALRLSGEVAMQQYLRQTESFAYQPTISSISMTEIFQGIKDIFSNHPVSKNKILTLPEKIPDISIRTDFSLLMRVLNNMLINAFEGTDEGDAVRMWIDPLPGGAVFSVWNKKAIPPDIAKRVFQRNFSTKADVGRGLGTYSMKLFGEEILGGKVDFNTSELEGTVFRFSLK